MASETRVASLDSSRDTADERRAELWDGLTQRTVERLGDDQTGHLEPKHEHTLRGQPGSSSRRTQNA